MRKITRRQYEMEGLIRCCLHYWFHNKTTRKRRKPVKQKIEEKHVSHTYAVIRTNTLNVDHFEVLDHARCAPVHVYDCTLYTKINK
ncbi:hypothetical protein YC2023_092049 [Brassica napus]